MPAITSVMDTWADEPHFFEITRAKKVVWEFSHQNHFKTMDQIQLPDVKGDAAEGEILR